MKPDPSRPRTNPPRLWPLLAVILSLVACMSADRQAVLGTLNAANAVLYGTPSRASTSSTSAPSTRTAATRFLPPAGNCLSFDRSKGYWVYVINKCSFGVDFLVNHEGGCGDWGCSDYVGRNKRKLFGGDITGRIRWFACASPGGLGDVLARRRENGTFYCYD